MIVNTALELRRRGGPRVRVQWIPAHTEVAGSEMADKLAKKATSKDLPRIPGLTLSLALKRAHTLVPRAKLDKPVPLDRALPGPHTKIIYDALTRRKAAILCQLRTGKSRLKSYLAKIGAAESDLCECGRQRPETVRHFLFECPQWDEFRLALREVAGNRWGDLSFCLGGRSDQRLPSGEPLDGKADSWKPDLDVLHRTIGFAIATNRLA